MAVVEIRRRGAHGITCLGEVGKLIRGRRRIEIFCRISGVAEGETPAEVHQNAFPTGGCNRFLRRLGRSRGRCGKSDND